MKPEQQSNVLLGITRSKAKMYEYDVPLESHIRIPDDPSQLFSLAVGLLGDLAAAINAGKEAEEKLETLRGHLKFSAYFFDSYRQTRLTEELDPYLLLLGSASYYLCDLPGSAAVLADHIGTQNLDFDCIGIEVLLVWLLKGEFSALIENPGGLFGERIYLLAASVFHHFHEGGGESSIKSSGHALRTVVYEHGTPRQLLFADVACALARKRHDNSSWHCLPQYSDLPTEAWLATLQKESFLKELWPAQRLLGVHGVFRGTSAVVQMPTSAGKTHATQLIIRSAFLSGRTSLAVLVAPFRALCHEIKDSLSRAFRSESVSIDEFSDVMQVDFELEATARNQIIIATPEKLFYILKHNSDLALNVGLLIYDEGHQFDSGVRGVTYELLLTSLAALVPTDTQKILISAVISNGASIGEWLNGPNSQVVAGQNLIPTYKSIAFTCWKDQEGRILKLGQLAYFTEKNLIERDFFVPRVIGEHKLSRRPRERKEKLFPDREDSNSVALYLGLKLFHKGGIAIFCGTKSTASALCDMAVDVYSRDLTLAPPATVSNPDEIRCLVNLHARNLGNDDSATQAASLGILSHHGNIPHGIRLAVEYAMKESLITFIVCTSTLAQGVNLPVRYLIVTSVYQGATPIKVRDFHNLIGRAGRSGMHTEGSIIFADAKIYDKRKEFRERWRWAQIKQLLEQQNSEPCQSTLLSVLDPWHNDRGDVTVPMNMPLFIRDYTDDASQLDKWATDLASLYSESGFTKPKIEKQIYQKVKIIAAIESYLMGHLSEDETDLDDAGAAELAHGTLAYHLADEEQRTQLELLFKLLANNISIKVPENSRQKIFAKSLNGVADSLKLEHWVQENIFDIVSSQTEEDLLNVIWPIFEQSIDNSTFQKINPSGVLLELAQGWITGKPFFELLTILQAANAKVGDGERPRNPQLEHIIELCENAFSYGGMLAIGSIAGIVENIQGHDEETISRLSRLQKRMRYGLYSREEVIIHELGFSDRVIAKELHAMLGLTSAGKNEITFAIVMHYNEIENLLSSYPKYFQVILSDFRP